VPVATASSTLFVSSSDSRDSSPKRPPLDLMLGSTGAEPPTKADVDHFFASTWRWFETRDRGFAHPTPVQGKWTIDGVGLPPAVLAKIYAGNAERVLGLPVTPR